MNKKILILDDELQSVNDLKDFLTSLKYEVEATIYAAHALEIMRDAKPAIVLFDYKMPDMDGNIFLTKAKEACDSSKYILITAYQDESVINRIKSLGAADVIMKPVELEQLLELIEKYLTA